MDRRRFLKYAAVSAAVAGSALAGYEFSRWQNSLVPRQTETITQTVTKSQTRIETTTETVRLASLYGRLFFDYNGNGVQDGEEPTVAGASVQLKDDSGSVIAEALTDSSGDYKLEDIRTGGTYRLHVEADKKFRYVCRSTQEVRAVSRGYDLFLDRSQSMDIGLMEGFLTFPFRRGNQWCMLNYDHDKELGRNHIWDWRGQNPNQPDNHGGTDFLFGPNKGGQVSWEVLYKQLNGKFSCDELIVASAPGRVVLDPFGSDIGAYVRTECLGRYMLDYGHLGEWYAKEDDFVGRNQPLGKPKCHFPATAPVSRSHLHFTLYEMGTGDPSDPYTVGDMKPLDPYRALWLPNSPDNLNFWTVNNDPKYPD